MTSFWQRSGPYGLSGVMTKPAVAGEAISSWWPQDRQGVQTLVKIYHDPAKAIQGTDFLVGFNLSGSPEGVYANGERPQFVHMQSVTACPPRNTLKADSRLKFDFQGYGDGHCIDHAHTKAQYPPQLPWTCSTVDLDNHIPEPLSAPGLGAEINWWGRVGRNDLIQDVRNAGPGPMYAQYPFYPARRGKQHMIPGCMT